MLHEVQTALDENPTRYVSSVFLDKILVTQPTPLLNFTMSALLNVLIKNI